MLPPKFGSNIIGVLFDVVREGNRRLDEGGEAGALVTAFDEIMAVLGLDEQLLGVDDLADQIARLADRVGTAPDIDGLLERRAQARAAGEFEISDVIRDELAALGIVVEDTADGVRWHRG